MSATDNRMTPPAPVVVEEHMVFTLTALCRATQADSAQVQALQAQLRRR